MKKVLIAVPCMEQVSARFAQSLAVIDKTGLTDCLVAFQIGSLVYDSRNKLALKAIQSKSDYVLWIDSDMIFERDTLVNLMKDAEEGRDIVAALAFKRVPPFDPVCYRLDGEGIKPMYDYPDEIFEADAVGFGCVLTKTSVLFEMFTEFGSCFEPVRGMGEDITFCKRARDMGKKMYVDPNVKTGHVGQLIVNEAAYKATRSE